MILVLKLVYTLFLLTARTRRGRRLLVLGAMSAFRAARSTRARETYRGARRLAGNARPRNAARRVVRKVRR
jgi:hypothetical protein